MNSFANKWVIFDANTKTILKFVSNSAKLRAINGNDNYIPSGGELNLTPYISSSDYANIEEISVKFRKIEAKETVLVVKFREDLPLAVIKLIKITS